MNNSSIFQDKELIDNKGTRFVLDKFLGRGKYGEVWKGHIVDSEEKVAVKIMHSTLSEQEKDQFLSEATILRLLRIAEDRENEHNFTRVPSLFPEFLGESEKNTQPAFFAQTLAPGVPLDDLWREKGQLSEVDALTIAEQFCQALYILHEKLNRSYLDFQPGNIFWDERTRHIMIIDWNLLTKEGTVRREDDLLQVGNILYRSLMGVKAPKAGSTRALAEPDGSNWEYISLPTQKILKKAFHINPNMRFQSATAFRDSLRATLDRLPATKEEFNNLLHEAGELLALSHELNAEQEYRIAEIASIVQQFV